MIYKPARGDERLLSFSREVVRDSLQVLRNSEHIARAQRARDELAKTETAGPEDDPP